MAEMETSVLDRTLDQFQPWSRHREEQKRTLRQKSWMDLSDYLKNCWVSQTYPLSMM